ncbi:hypothetical protein EVAR_91469_1 [Eumeta japonica]|uniref:Uncharacterized protein n=1 Tax=Eumeta variegata TaxID=151549 RepID=A0A4C1X3E9_EUMVA|nr:hypothetical protein EVAR_91469_1 [Eumeta japonica]
MTLAPRIETYGSDTPSRAALARLAARRTRPSAAGARAAAVGARARGTVYGESFEFANCLYYTGRGAEISQFYAYGMNKFNSLLL